MWPCHQEQAQEQAPQWMCLIHLQARKKKDDDNHENDDYDDDGDDD